MLDPLYIDKLPDEMVEYISELEISIAKDIAKRISKFNYNSSMSVHQIRKLKQLGLHQEEISKLISRFTNISEGIINNIVMDAVYHSVSFDLRENDESITAEEIMSRTNLKKILVDSSKALNSEMRNITNTMAKASNDILIKSLDLAFLETHSGAFTYQQAINKAVDKLASDGIQWISYDGYRNRPEVVVRRNVLTASNQAANKATIAVAIELDYNFMETSSHLGARPTHAVWQGKTFWLKEPYKNMENFYEATRYGFGDGLAGWNCKHSAFGKPQPYPKTFKHFNQKENNKLYEKTQIQRYNERKIREWKRRLETMKAGGQDFEKENAKVKYWQKRQRDLLKKNPELARDYQRERIGKKHV